MKNANHKSTLFLTRSAIIAALYVGLTMLCYALGLSSGVIQLRISEALCILPIFLPEAVPGLFIGCMLSNLLCGGVIWDVLFGAVATLIGAIGARALRRLPARLIFLATAPTVIANAIIVPLVLIYAYGSVESFFFIMLTVSIGEIICATLCGTALYFYIKRYGFFSHTK